VIRCKPQSCVGCALHSHGTDFSAIEGTGSSGVLILAEASGEHEQRDQLPLRPWAPAGGVLERAFRRMGLDRQMFSITNTVRCRPKNNWLESAPWEYSAINHCRPNLDAAIAERRPKCIVALGGIALRELTGLSGEKLGISYLAGYPLPMRGTNIPVVGTFHPAFIRRGKAAYQGIFARHIQRAMNIAAGKDAKWFWEVEPEIDDATVSFSHDTPLRMPPNKRYVLHPSVDDVRSRILWLKDNPRVPIAKDIETPESAGMDEDARDGFSNTHIRQFQFSVAANEGMAMPWQGEYIKLAAEILHLPNISYGHNWNNFDHKVLRAAAQREGWRYAPNVWVMDTMDMFHHWQPDLPAHLQAAAQFVSFEFPWKHLHTIENEPFYGCVDTDSAWQLGEFLQGALKRDGIWGDDTCGYLGQVYEVRPVLAAMEDRGLPIDDVARVALGAEFDLAQRELGLSLLDQFPESAKKLDLYKTFPPELKKLPEAEWGKLFQEPDKWKCKCGKERSMTLAHCDCGREQSEGKVKAGKWYRYGQREVAEPTIGENGEPALQMMMRWCYIPQFNPNSGKQLIEYMKAKGHKVPKSREEDADGNPKDTTEKVELQRLARKVGDQFYLKVIEYRELGKAKGTYVEGFKPHADGCVHTTFTFDTAIAQLSSRNPATMNFPKHGRLSKALRRMVAAKEGNVIVEWDYKSCHVLTLGFLAEDYNYMRLARLDMHSFVTGHLLGLWDGRKILPESDEALLARFKWLKSNPEYKKVRDDRSKRTILGIGNGLKAKGLYERYPDSFKAIKDAQSILDVVELIFPALFPWQEKMQKLAHEQQQLRTDFGHLRRFYEVFRWDAQKCKWGHGDQAEEAIAYVLANVAHAHMRETMKKLHRIGLAEKYGMFNVIHDALKFHFPEHLLDAHVREVYPIMVAPSTVLKHPTIAPNGLHIDCEASWGRNWAEMSELKLPAALAVEEAVIA
jgi:uracil-DNA glycosylase family 4